jgi:hypothetical protein
MFALLKVDRFSTHTITSKKTKGFTDTGQFSAVVGKGGEQKFSPFSLGKFFCKTIQKMS